MIWISVFRWGCCFWWEFSALIETKNITDDIDTYYSNQDLYEAPILNQALELTYLVNWGKWCCETFKMKLLPDELNMPWHICAHRKPQIYIYIEWHNLGLQYVNFAFVSFLWLAWLRIFVVIVRLYSLFQV